jgi:hypothetical protein
MLDKCAYLVCLIIHAIFSVVHKLPAIIRSPSFSLFSSSMTTRNSPWANAANASSIESKANDDLTEGFCTSVGALELDIAGFASGLDIVDIPFAFIAEGNWTVDDIATGDMETPMLEWIQRRKTSSSGDIG